MQAIIFTDTNGIPGFGRYAGAYKVATELRANGYTTQVIDFFSSLSLADIERIVHKFVDSESLFVGFSSTFLSQIDYQREKPVYTPAMFPHDDKFMFQVIELFKRKNPRLKFVVGGANANQGKPSFIDYFLIGESDRSIVDLASSLELENSKKRRTIYSQLEAPYKDFARSTIRWEHNDHSFEGEHLPIEISRGCIFNCAFCSYPKRGKEDPPHRDTDVLRDDLLRNYELYKTTGYMFCDELYNDTMYKTKTLHELFTQLPFEIEWSSYLRIDMFKKYPEMRELLLESGIRAGFFGLETFHRQAGKNVGKPMDSEIIKDLLFYLKDLWADKVNISASFIVGLPGETEDSIWKTVEWATSKDSPIDACHFAPLSVAKIEDEKGLSSGRDSRMSQDPQKFGLGEHQSGWSHGFMDAQRARSLVKEIYSTPQMRNRSLASFVGYNRLKNLGYNDDEVKNVRLGDAGAYEELLHRRENLFSKYKSQLIGENSERYENTPLQLTV